MSRLEPVVKSEPVVAKPELPPEVVEDAPSSSGVAVALRPASAFDKIKRIADAIKQKSVSDSIGQIIETATGLESKPALSAKKAEEVAPVVAAKPALAVAEPKKIKAAKPIPAPLKVVPPQAKVPAPEPVPSLSGQQSESEQVVLSAPDQVASSKKAKRATPKSFPKLVMVDKEGEEEGGIVVLEPAIEVDKPRTVSIVAVVPDVDPSSSDAAVVAKKSASSVTKLHKKAGKKKDLNSLCREQAAKKLPVVTPAAEVVPEPVAAKIQQPAAEVVSEPVVVERTVQAPVEELACSPVSSFGTSDKLC